VNGEHLQQFHYGARITNEVVSGELEWSCSAFEKMRRRVSSTNGPFALESQLILNGRKGASCCHPRVTSMSPRVCSLAFQIARENEPRETSGDGRLLSSTVSNCQPDMSRPFGAEVKAKTRGPASEPSEPSDN
jgi:hypothetical protein